MTGKEEKPPIIRKELKQLLVDNLDLDITAEEISDSEVLFGEGLNLDSLDAVEIVTFLQRNYEIEIKDMKIARKVFYSIDTLADFVCENMKNKDA